MQGCGSRAYLASVAEIWPAFSAFAEAVPALTDPPRERPNRLLAKFLFGQYLASLGAFRMFLDRNLDVLHGWIAEGRLAFAGHLLEIQVNRQEHVSPFDELPSFVHFIEQDNVVPLCTELATACRALLDRGTLLGTLIADLACLRAVLSGSEDRWGDDARQKFDELLDRPAQLDRFIWYCFGEEEPGIAYVYRLIKDRKLLRTRIIRRLESAASTMPEQVRSAYDNADFRTVYLDYDAPQQPTGIEPITVNNGGSST